MNRNLSRLLRPRRVAAIGGRWAEQVVLQCRKMNFAGEIFAVNPRRKTLGGARCFASVAELPAPPDAAFIGVNRRATAETARALAAAGCGGAVCFASGFAEAGGAGGVAGAKLQKELVAAAGEMPILGPNSYGFINYLDGALLWPDQHGGIREKSGVAIIGQSSNILINITSQRRALPLAYIAAAGNQAQTNIAAIARGVLADRRVRAIGFYIEGVGDAADFAAMAAAAARAGVGLAAVKAGGGKLSAAAAASHTAVLTGGAAASSAFLRQCGVAEVQTIPQMLEALKLLYVRGKQGKRRGKQSGRKIFSLSCSGGEAGHIADLAKNTALQFPPPPAKTKKQLAQILGPLVRAANPLDYHTFIWHDAKKLTATYRAALSAGGDLTFLIYDYPREDRCSRKDWDLPMKAFLRAAKAEKTPAAVVSVLPENIPEETGRMLTKNNIAPLCGLAEALAAADAAAFVAEFSAKSANKKNWRPLAEIPATKQTKQKMLDEHAAKEILRAAGINCPQGVIAKTPAELQTAAKKFNKNPAARFAVKQLGVAHKTESGGVKLNIAAESIAAVCKTMANKTKTSGGFLAEEMVGDIAAELLLCVRREAVYGASLTVGAGGQNAEWMADTETIILPANKKQIAAAINNLRCAPLLRGWRGAAAANIAAAAESAAKLAALLQADSQIAEIEINPLLLTEDGRAVAADALLYNFIAKGEKQ